MPAAIELGERRMTPRRAADSAVGTTLKQIDRYGTGNVFAVILLGFVLGTMVWFGRDLHAMLEDHIASSTEANRATYQGCVNLAIIAGTSPQLCFEPRPSR